MQTHCEVLQMAIKWEQDRAVWFTSTQQWGEVEQCLQREHQLEQDLAQARIDAAAMAENRAA